MRIVFACVPFPGHLNPTLPVVQALVRLGHDVHYICAESARAKIESSGASFHNCVELQPELYEGRKLSGPLGAMGDVMDQNALDPSSFLSMMRVSSICVEMELPGALRFLRHMKPDVLVYDPLLTCRYASLAARILAIPAVGLLTIAGPGALREHSPASMKPLTITDLDNLVREFDPHRHATARLNSEYGLALEPGLYFPDCYMDTCLSNTVLVTTSQELQDPMTSELSQKYEECGTNFVFVGPLLLEATADVEHSEDAMVRKVREARESCRSVVAISLGTVVTSEHSVMGWDARAGGASITGKELCRAVWGGVFDALGAERPDAGVLVVAALGLQADPLGDLHVPSNALHAPFFDQVNLLKAGVDVFVTHGGQNSFTEAMAHGVPVVVCPGFGDQHINAHKAVKLGVGLKVDRPVAAPDEEADAAVLYRAKVSDAVRQVLSNGSFRQAAQLQAEKLHQTGGVPRAVEVVLEVAQSGNLQGTINSQAQRFGY